MRYSILLAAGLLGSQLARAQQVAPKGKLIVNEKLISRFIRQTYALQKAAVAQHFRKKTEPVPDWLMPAPGDRMVTYYQPGDTLLFYQSSRALTLYWCSLTNAARLAPAVPFLASPKQALLAGKYQTHPVITAIDSPRAGVYTLILTFQGSYIRRLYFNLDTSTF